VGLLCPLAANENYELLAGRRRFQALIELGWKEVECHVILVNGDGLRAFKIAFDENLKRKPLTDPEAFSAIAEYHDLQSLLRGNKDTKLQGKDSFGRHIVASDEGWSQDETAKDLGISRQAVGKGLKLDRIVKEYPDLAKETNGQAILAEYKRRTLESVALPAARLAILLPTLPFWTALTCPKSRASQ